jgi:glycosyltransferase involved in cell wall biosynthesis
MPSTSPTSCGGPAARPVLLVALAKNYGGADVRVIQIARALHGSRPYAVAALQGSETHRALQSLSLNVLALPFGRADPRNLFALYAYMRGAHVGVVDTQNPQSHVWGLLAAQLAGVRRRVWTIHSDYRNAGSRWKAASLRHLLRLGRIGRCEFVVVSRQGADYLRSLGVPDSRIHVSHNAVPDMQAADLALEEQRSSRKARVICIAGRLDPIKGHRFLFQALCGLRDRYPQLRSVVIGDGPAKQALQHEVARLKLEDIVSFTGFRADVHAVMARCDLFCLPSLSEGLPFAMLEAALLGIPTVASAVGEIPYHFHHGVTARLVPPGDVEELVREISWALDHPEKAAEMALRAKEMVRQHFSPARMFAETLAVYDGDALA